MHFGPQEGKMVIFWNIFQTEGDIEGNLNTAYVKYTGGDTLVLRRNLRSQYPVDFSKDFSKDLASRVFSEQL